MNIVINQKEYIFKKGIRDDHKIRKSFNQLAKQSFGFDFEAWYQLGFWNDKYIPYVLLDGEVVVANVSISLMDFCLSGEIRKYIQIGTVMTDTNYRNQGLSRFLIERVLEDWQGNCDAMYLFANDSVKNFYPKFGFVSVQEYQLNRKVTANNVDIKVEKLNMEEQSDLNLLKNKSARLNPYSLFAAKSSEWLVLFYAISFFNDKFWYIPQYDTIVVADFEGDTMNCYDIYGTGEIPMDIILSAVTKQETKKVVFGFTPREQEGCNISLLKQEDTTLFYKTKDQNTCKENQRMFPILSRA
ncbi:GNAT family N-acetyltransferase [Paenibacillus polymyxa]|uniref:GNAT family N-acetyltransferase n=1 Tax=Paenibacillus polymyxa TaxID=1406 RepID=UPI0003D2ECDB|nr:GNAT family N-acetyltransferase [Paenibacillus polymyxa]AIW40444.1 GNAT family acetyltransferase [Paenibacillus polymyxa CR1]